MTVEVISWAVLESEESVLFSLVLKLLLDGKASLLFFFLRDFAQFIVNGHFSQGVANVHVSHGLLSELFLLVENLDCELLVSVDVLTKRDLGLGALAEQLDGNQLLELDLLLFEISAPGGL